MAGISITSFKFWILWNWWWEQTELFFILDTTIPHMVNPRNKTGNYYCTSKSKYLKSPYNSGFLFLSKVSNECKIKTFKCLQDEKLFIQIQRKTEIFWRRNRETMGNLHRQGQEHINRKENDRIHNWKHQKWNWFCAIWLLRKQRKQRRKTWKLRKLQN